MSVIKVFLVSSKPFTYNLEWTGKKQNLIRKLTKVEYDEVSKCSHIIVTNRESGSDFMRAITSVSLTNVEEAMYTVMISWYDTGVRHL